MEKPSVRRLQRKRLNADFMRTKGYDVEDNPTLKPEDLKQGIKANNRPDHRIDGKIYDSCAPKLTITDWDERVEYELRDFQRYLGLEPKWELHDITKNILRNIICEKIRDKVVSGQVENILLNLSDIAGSEELLRDSQLGKTFERIPSLERVVCIYPKKERDYRGMTEGEGTTWENLLPCDMAAVHWIKGIEIAGSSSLHDGGYTQTTERHTHSEYVISEPTRTATFSGLGILLTWIGYVLGTVLKWNGSILGILLKGIGVVAATVGAIASFPHRRRSLKALKIRQNQPTESSKVALKMYRAQMLPIVRSCNNTQLNKAHNDMIAVAKKLIPSFAYGNSQLEEILAAEYQTLLMRKKALTIFDNLVEPLFMTSLLFLYIVSRSVDTFIAIATKKVTLHSRILGTLFGLVIFCFTGQHLFSLVHLGILCGPLKIILYVCMVCMVVWLLHGSGGYFAWAASCIKYGTYILWEKTEKDYMEVTKLTLPQRAAVTITTSSITYVSYRVLKLISDFSTILEIPWILFAPWNFFVKMLGYAEFLGNVLLITSLFTLVLLVILVLDMAFPRSTALQKILMCKNIDYKGTTVCSLLDSLWKDVEGFINSKPYEEIE